MGAAHRGGQHSGAPFSACRGLLGLAAAKRTTQALLRRSPQLGAKKATRLIHQDDSYLGSLSLYSASLGLSRLVKGHGDLKREKLPLERWRWIHPSGQRKRERARHSHQDNFIRDAESHFRGCSVWCLEDPWKSPNPSWPAQGAPR